MTDEEKLEKVKEYLESIKKTRSYEKYLETKKLTGDRLNFNLFKLTSEKTHYENYQSCILQKVFETPQHLEAFITHINSNSKLNIDAEIYLQNKFNVTLEEPTINTQSKKGRIDIFIKTRTNNEKHCIIVENKINWAKDQKGQLEKYYNWAKKLKYKIDAIVYLVPDAKKEPSAESYGDSKSKIKKKFILITGFNGRNNDLYSCLSKSLKKMLANFSITDITDEKIAIADEIFLLKHYLDLLKDTGVGDMADVENIFFSQIIKSGRPEDLETAIFIQKMMNELPRIIIENFIKEIEDSFQEDSFWYKDYQTPKDKSYYQIAINFENPSTPIIGIYILGCSETGLTFNKKEKTLLENLHKFKNWHLLDTQRRKEIHKSICFKKEFSYPNQHSKLITTIKELDKILKGITS